MRAVIIGLVFVAVILAGGTAYLLRDYISAQQAELAAQKPVAPTTQILVAKNDMPVGTVINADNTEWLKWPKGEVPEGYLEKTPDKNPLKDIEKDRYLSRRGFVQGEPITMSRLYKSDDPGFLRGALDPGMRAVAVRTSAENAASGFILPGDRVDLVLTHDLVQRAQQDSGQGDGLPISGVSETILENLRVLAVDQKTNEFQGGAAVSKTILLEVTPKQAEIINTAKSMGSLSLALRAAEEGAPRTDAPYTTDVEVSPLLSSLTGKDGAKSPSGSAAQAKPAPAAVKPRYKPAPQSREITIYRGNSTGTTAGGQTGAAQ